MDARLLEQGGDAHQGFKGIDGSPAEIAISKKGNGCDCAAASQYRVRGTGSQQSAVAHGSESQAGGIR
jgi:hypothetical protein